jgi:integrase
VDIILEQYRTRLVTIRKRKPATVRAFDKAAEKFQEHLEILGKPAKALSSWELEEYLAGLELAQTTKHTHWIHLGGAYREAHRRGIITKDITADVYLAPAERKAGEIITNDELRQMKHRIVGDRQWVLFHLLTYTGMRQGEVLGLRWCDVDIPQGTMFLGKTKNGLDRLVPIHPVLLDVLIEARGGTGDSYVLTTTGTTPISTNTWTAYLKQFAPGYSSHWFRRTVTQSLLENEVEIHVVKWILGWSPQGVMERFYSRASIKLMQRAILKLYADDPI